MNILFVCRGNVGRSQIAEAILRHKTNGRFSAQSAGTEAMGSDGKDLDGMLLKDRASSQYAIECLKEIGIDASNHFIKRLSPSMIQNADKIFVLVKPSATPDFLKENPKVTYWDLEDPDEQDLEFYRKTRDEIIKLVENI